MATINSRSALTLVDLAKLQDPNGNLATIAEVLEESNPILEDAQWMEANGKTSHDIVRRLSLPSGSIRTLNNGVAAEVSNTVHVVEGMEMLESWSQCDKALADMSGNSALFRSNEAKAFLEGMGQTYAESMVYGNASTTPGEIDGFATRMATIDADGVVIDGGGSSTLTSIYAVQWGANKVMGIYPMGGAGNVGITHTDLGEQILTNSTTSLDYLGYKDHFKIHGGIAVYNSKCIGRYANINTTVGGANAFDEDYLIRLTNRMLNGGRGVTYYVSTEILSQMQIRLKDKTNVWFSSGKGNGLSGEEIMFFMGHPVKMVDQILNAETEITT